jgi:predicted ATPase
VEYLGGWSKTAPILVLCLARPELLETRPGWSSAGGESVTLEALSTPDSDRLVRNLLGQSDLPADVRARIEETTEGNPLFVEEMLRILIDDGLLRWEADRWVATRDLSTVRTPATVQSLLAARIERLPAGERAVLQLASVVGKVFWWGAMAELSSVADRSGVGSRLQALVRRELIRPDTAPFAGEDAFRFRHILIRDAAYQSLPLVARADLHERFATWMERSVTQEVHEFDEIIGHHLEQAVRYLSALRPGDDRIGDMAVRAATYLADSGLRALRRGIPRRQQTS